MDMMLDTCGLLSLSGIADRKLSESCLGKIAGATRLYVSACSLFEIAIKHKRRQMSLGSFSSPKEYWGECVEFYGLNTASVTAEDFVEAVNLPEVHSDPFDRIIITQALRLSCSIVTYDRFFESYQVEMHC